MKIRNFIFKFLVFFYIGLSTFGQSVLISPNNGSKLIETNSTNKAVQMPSVSGTSAITSPQKGMVVFDDATGTLSYYNGSQWIPLSNSTTGWAINANTLNNTNTGNVGIGTTAPVSKLHTMVGDAGSFSPRSGTIQTLETNGFSAYLSILSQNGATAGIAFGSPDGNADGSLNYNHALNKFTLVTKSATRVAVDSVGNVGIGEINPSEKLEVNGNVLAKKIAINTTGATPNTNAILDISSTDKGVLFPRMTTTQRNLIPNTAGLTVYDITTKGFWFNDGTVWQPINQFWDFDESKAYSNSFNNVNAVGIGAIPLNSKTGTVGPGCTDCGGSVTNGRLQITGTGNSDQLSLIHPTGPNIKWGLYTSYTDSSFNFYANGSLRASIDRITGVYSTLSDRNLKKNITGLNPVLNKVLKLNAYNYNYLKSENTDRKTFGFMAQDVEPIFPELIYHKKDRETNEPFLMMDYSSFGVIAIKAIQEQQALIEKLQSQIDELKKLIK